MFVKDIQLLSFRNYENIYFKPHRKMNIFYGQNAQGKTNLLEAIYILLRAKSFRQANDRQAIAFDKDFSFIRGRVESFGFDYIHEVKLSRKEAKKLRVNEESIDSLLNYNRNNPVVLFQPEDILMVKEGPDLRRAYLNNLLDQVDGSYGSLLKSYRQILYQKNLALKKEEDPLLFDVYDRQLSQLGSQIILKRFALVRLLGPRVQENYERISRGGREERVTISYQSSFSEDTSLEDMKKIYWERLKKDRPKDLHLKTTSFGPHREDLDIKISGREAKNYASQGQQRSIVLAFKLGELEVIKKLTSQMPVLLLDDVFSELDDQRQALFFSSIRDCQSFITTTDPLKESPGEDRNLKQYKIENNQVKER